MNSIRLCSVVGSFLLKRSYQLLTFGTLSALVSAWAIPEASAMTSARPRAVTVAHSPRTHTHKKIVSSLPVQTSEPPVKQVGRAQSPTQSGLGPSVGLYVNSEGSPLLPLIRSSRRQLDIEIYTMGDAEVRNAIRDAIHRKVRVRVVQEPSPVGAACDVFRIKGGATKTTSDCADSQQLVNDVKAAGGSYVPFQKDQLCGQPGAGCFEHGKLAIADAAIALVSTGNFDSTNLCDAAASPSHCNRDYSVITEETDVVGSLEGIFEKDLGATRYDVSSVITKSALSKMTVSPLSLAPIVSFIQSAKSSILLENQYLKEPTINAALIAAAKRGVRVELSIASACAFAKPQPALSDEWTQTYASFEQAGISVRAFTKHILVNGKPGYLHAKAIVIDGSRAWVGSVNGSTTSTSANREFGLFLTEQGEVAKLADQMSRDQRDPNAETWQDSLICAKD